MRKTLVEERRGAVRHSERVQLAFCGLVLAGQEARGPGVLLRYGERAGYQIGHLRPGECPAERYHNANPGGLTDVQVAHTGVTLEYETVHASTPLWYGPGNPAPAWAGFLR